MTFRSEIVTKVLLIESISKFNGFLACRSDFKVLKNDQVHAKWILTVFFDYFYSTDEHFRWVEANLRGKVREMRGKSEKVMRGEK